MILSIENWYEIWTWTYFSVAIGIIIDDQKKMVPDERIKHDLSTAVEVRVDNKMKQLNTTSP